MCEKYTIWIINNQPNILFLILLLSYIMLISQIWFDLLYCSWEESKVPDHMLVL